MPSFKDTQGASKNLSTVAEPIPSGLSSVTLGFSDIFPNQTCEKTGEIPAQQKEPATIL